MVLRDDGRSSSRCTKSPCSLTSSKAPRRTASAMAARVAGTDAAWAANGRLAGGAPSSMLSQAHPAPGAGILMPARDRMVRSAGVAWLTHSLSGMIGARRVGEDKKGGKGRPRVSQQKRHNCESSQRLGSTLSECATLFFLAASGRKKRSPMAALPKPPQAGSDAVYSVDDVAFAGDEFRMFQVRGPGAGGERGRRSFP